MALFDLQIMPGVYRENTARGARSRWYYADKVRFAAGLPEKIGGWSRQTGGPVTGVARNTHDWVSLDSQKWIAVGTEKKLYLWQSGVFYDITPLRRASTGTVSPFNQSPLTNPFTTTNLLAVVVVTHASHGAIDGDRVRFYNATAVGGITISGEYAITVTGTDTYTITHGSAATSSATGGGTVNFEYDIGVTSNGLGWGAGTWGSGTWGTPRTSTNLIVRTRLWSLDNWGEDLIASPRGGAIYTWDRTGGPSVRATIISGAPSQNNRVLVSRQDRHLISLGSHDGSAFDPLLIRWSDTEDYNTWTPTLTNQAGDKRLDSGSEIVTGVHSRDETLIYTDTSAHLMRYDGAPFVFAFANIAGNVPIMGPNAIAEASGIVFGMGVGSFYVYDGTLRPLDCDVHSYVFDNFNFAKKDIVCSGVRAKFSEAWWAYPSSGSSECDRYVAFNWLEGHWTIGTLDMTSMDSEGPVFNVPYAMHSDGYLYKHETGTDANTGAMTTDLESWMMEIAPGEKFLHIDKLIPDFLTLTGAGSVSIKSKTYPQDSTTVTKGPFSVTSSTKKVSLRSRGRQVSLRWQMSALSDDFRMGTWRVNGMGHGRRA